VLLKKPLVVSVVLAVLARLGAQLVLGAYASPTTWEYEDIANSLLGGHGYVYTEGQTAYVAAVSSPLYVLLTAAVYFVTDHSHAVMLVLQALFGGATAALSVWLAARMGRIEAAWAAGILVALDPGLLVYSAELHPLSLDALAFLTVICATVALPLWPRWRDTAVVGLALGIAALTRTTVLSLTPILLLWAARYRCLRLISPAAAALVVVALLVYSPWPVRNSVLLGQVLVGSSESSEWLWRGTNPNATGSSYTTDQQTMLSVAPPEFQARIAAASEAERMTIYRDAVVQYVGQHPLDAIRLYLVKLKAFWLGSDTTGALYPALWTPLYEAWFGLVLIFGAFGVWSTWREVQARSVSVLIIASLLLVASSQAFFYVEGRHRLAVEPLLLVLAGVGLGQMGTLRRFARIGTPELAGVREELTDSAVTIRVDRAATP
jgi:4-amino-4-deoxy-L-arabinose transferase-like glycosyltransferase